MQRSIWISHEDWELIKTAAAVAQKSLSQYLLHLHKMNITSRGINIPPVVLVEPEKPLKEAVIVNIESPKPEIPSPASASSGTGDFFKPRPKGQDGVKRKAK